MQKQIDDAFHRQVWLPCGGYIVIDETEALIAIDVNTGRNKGGKDVEKTILQTNLEAADEMARQMRLRNIGGLIIGDFIDMKSRKDQQRSISAMKERLKRDKAKTHVLPISPLGLMEMTRQRAQEILSGAVYETCPYCHGRGKVKSAMTMSVELQRTLHQVMRKYPGHDPRNQSHRASARARTPAHAKTKNCSSTSSANTPAALPSARSDLSPRKIHHHRREYRRGVEGVAWGVRALFGGAAACDHRAFSPNGASSYQPGATPQDPAFQTRQR